MPGPLHGFKLVELGGIGAGPFAGMMLSDMGAERLRVDRVGWATTQDPSLSVSPVGRGCRTIGVDLKQPGGADVVLRLVERADALIESFRPGVTERLGLGPDECLKRNQRLVYGRMTGWGQDGPYAHNAGHDINYVALSGTLSMIGRYGEAPIAPLNLVGDHGGGGLLLAYGVVCALLEASLSGSGQVVDAAMVDGSAMLGASIHGLRAAGVWKERGTNLIDGGAPYYEVYETADGRYISLGAIEPHFYELMIRLTGLADDVDRRGPLADQNDRKSWPLMKERLTALVKSKTRDEWCALLEGTDACFAPVLELDEAAKHPHNLHRQTFIEIDGVLQARPAPRFSRSHADVPQRRPPDEDVIAIMSAWGFDADEVTNLRYAGVVS
jgi:alpha-methylacyl-CoA racemase